MIIEIAAKTFDLSGHLVIDALPESNLGEIARRSTKVAALDGTVAVNDQAFSHGDRNMEFTYQPVSTAHDDIARRIVRVHNRVIVTIPEGCFEAIPGPFYTEPDGNTFVCQIIDKISED